MYSRPSVDRHFAIAFPHLIAPRSDTVFNSINTPTFIWSRVDSASFYILKVATDAGFYNVIINHALADTAYTTLSPLGDGHYYWCVVTVLNGNSYVSSTQPFGINVYGGVAEQPGLSMPTAFQMDAPYPNPARERTVIGYQLPAASRTKLDLYNINGQRVATLVDGTQSAGRHSIAWNLRNDKGCAVANGVYVLRLTAGSRHMASTLAVIR
jgi:hypothetical protein